MSNDPKLHHSTLGRMSRLALLLLASASLHAQQGVVLRGEAEVPPVTTAATGSGQITVLPDHSVSGTIKVAGITATAAHIHHGVTGSNGPVIVPLRKISDETFSVPPGAKFSDEQYANYLAGELYVNVHSAANPSGEIRCQLTPPMEAPKAAPRAGY